MSPTQRTLKALREQGATCQVVEKWNQFAKIRQDLFGGIDVVALEQGKPGVLGVQACAVGSQSARIAKLKEEVRLWQWVRCANRLEVWGWGQRRSTKVNKDGKRSKKMIHAVTVTVLTLTEAGEWEEKREVFGQ